MNMTREEKVIQVVLRLALHEVSSALCEFHRRLRAERDFRVPRWLEGGPWPGIRLHLPGSRIWIVFDSREGCPYLACPPGLDRSLAWCYEETYYLTWGSDYIAPLLSRRVWEREALELIYCLRAVAGVVAQAGEAASAASLENKLYVACRKAAMTVAGLTDQQVLEALQAEAALLVLGK